MKVLIEAEGNVNLQEKASLNPSQTCLTVVSAASSEKRMTSPLFSSLFSCNILQHNDSSREKGLVRARAALRHHASSKFNSYTPPKSSHMSSPT